MYLYKIINKKSNSIYIGITKTTLRQRFNNHKSASNRGVKSILYDAMRSYGNNNFEIILLNTYNDRKSLEKAEYNAIKCFRKSGYNLYNILEGGSSYFPIIDKKAWKAKLKIKRKGRKPALGMKHTDENKKLFSKVSNEYWKNTYTYPKKDIIKYSFKEANEKFGISKTHYYRIRKQLAKK